MSHGVFRTHRELPDITKRIVARLAETVGIGAVHGYIQKEEGWDSTVYEINGEWIVRVPRREEIRQLARRPCW